MTGLHCRDCLCKEEEGAGFGTSVCPDLLGYTRATMAETMGYNPERGS